MNANLRRREAHFEFGENWLSFLDGISDDRIVGAVEGLRHLFPDGELSGKRFLDIGSGSGLSLLAALKLGASEVLGVDIDENSVRASRRCLARFAAGGNWQVRQASVFDLDAGTIGRYDVVHSWGVLHHTGDLWTALDKAASLVADEGLLALALYVKTPFCGLWRAEKYFYSHFPRFIQAPIRWLYFVAGLVKDGARLAAVAVRLRKPVIYPGMRERSRGMSRSHDLHDWLGGYPYESASAEEVHERLLSLGFRIVRENLRSVGIGSMFFGSENNEYVASRKLEVTEGSAAVAQDRVGLSWPTARGSNIRT